MVFLKLIKNNMSMKKLYLSGPEIECELALIPLMTVIFSVFQAKALVLLKLRNHNALIQKKISVSRCIKEAESNLIAGDAIPVKGTITNSESKFQLIVDNLRIWYQTKNQAKYFADFLPHHSSKIFQLSAALFNFSQGRSLINFLFCK